MPADAYYGVQTARALENFQISQVTMRTYPEFVEGFAIVKLAAARANTKVGAMKPERLAAIEKAYQAIMAGKISRPVRRGLVSGRRRHLGQHERQRSDGQHRRSSSRATRRANTSTCEPHDDLNMSQSTNDSYPTAIKVAFLFAKRETRRGARAPVGGLSCEGAAVSDGDEDGTHRTAGCGAHDGGAGVPRVRVRAGR